MAVSTAQSFWEGDLKSGKGGMKTGSGSVDAPFSFGTRFEGAAGTNPEELLGAAHSGCFSMALSHGLASAGFTPKKVTTSAKVHLEKVPDGFAITLIELDCQAVVPNIDEKKFQEIATATKTGCPVSKALAAVKIDLKAALTK